MTWEPQRRLSVISGPNGSGKTNLLEAVSYLAPGRGLRGARLSDLPRVGGDGRWGVAARIGDVDLATGSAPEGDRRVWRIDGETPRSQQDIAALFACVWLTPQMDRLFGEGASGRRRFLDRLVWALEPGHAREIAAHDRAMQGRNRLLAAGGADPAWLSALEASMTRHAVAAAVARRSLVARLNAALDGGAAGGFPPARLGLHDPVAARLEGEPALAVEDWLRGALAAARTSDAQAGAAALGAHRADLTLADAATGLAAGQASTGQQKSLLVGVILGHAALVTAARGTPPILLLDEPLVHLDEARRTALLAALAETPGQVLLTGTDASAFEALRGRAEFLVTGGGGLRPNPVFEGGDALY